MQAKYIFEIMGADATTLHPYMGEDSVIPFFEYSDQFHFVLGLTSNPGASTFETQRMHSLECLFARVIRQCSNWNMSFNNVGVVVGATHSELQSIRDIDSDLLFLIPGVGAQGGDYARAVEFGKNNLGLCLVNAARSVLYGDTSISHRSVERITSTLISNRIHSIQ
jgi:orotidine-5'-phosphate decarboxylase